MSTDGALNAQYGTVSPTPAQCWANVEDVGPALSRRPSSTPSVMRFYRLYYAAGILNPRCGIENDASRWKGRATRKQ